VRYRLFGSALSSAKGHYQTKPWVCDNVIMRGNNEGWNKQHFYVE
jgi:hypothetical protein